MDLLKIDSRSFIRRRIAATTNGATTAYTDTANKFSRSLKVIKAQYLQAFAPPALCRWNVDWQLETALSETAIGKQGGCFGSALAVNHGPADARSAEARHRSKTWNHRSPTSAVAYIGGGDDGKADNP
jgi:hypothetical protein